MSPSNSNLHKSPAGWARLHDRRAAGVRVRGAKMDSRPKSMIGAKANLHFRPKAEQGDAPEFVTRKGRQQRRVRIAS